jgi:hypothetical protein
MTYQYNVVTATDETVNGILKEWAGGGWDLYTATSIVWGQCTKINPGTVYHYLFFCREN